ncbi:hypothetical protein RA278_28095, partial [Pseudomonas syringae pv. tagetis]
CLVGWCLLVRLFGFLGCVVVWVGAVCCWVGDIWWCAAVVGVGGVWFCGWFWCGVVGGGVGVSLGWSCFGVLWVRGAGAAGVGGVVVCSVFLGGLCMSRVAM